MIMHCTIGLMGGYIGREADTILTDAIPTDDRDSVRVLGIGLMVGLELATLHHSSYVGTKSVGKASVGICVSEYSVVVSYSTTDYRINWLSNYRTTGLGLGTNIGS